MAKVKCPNCGNEVELTNKGILQGEEFGKCDKCKCMVLKGYDPNNEVTAKDFRKDAFINNALSKEQRDK